MDGFCWRDSRGFYYDSLEFVIWGGVLGFCCCGEPRVGMKQLKSILESVELSEGADATEYEDSTVLSLYVLDKIGLTKHGFSIYRSRLSEKGQDILTVLRYLVDNKRDKYDTI